MIETPEIQISKKSKIFTCLLLLSYPFMFLFGCFSLIFIVPKFKTIFDDMLKGEPLPFLTAFIISIGDFYKSFGFLGFSLTIATFILLSLPVFNRRKVYIMKNRNLILFSIFLPGFLFLVTLVIAMLMPMRMIMDKL